MLSLTDSVSSSNWLESNKDIKLSAYVEAFSFTLGISGQPSEQHGITETLKQGHFRFLLNDYFFDSLLDSEFQSWESLSDEALINFERKLS